jgi:2',3'-cyclic-nucleotide 2'-phosphodiesterase (5'-nucleotidase family)
MKFLKHNLLVIVVSFFVVACSKYEYTPTETPQNEVKELTIFHINDIHGSIDNFSKIKFIVDQEREISNVLFVCAGDTFSGNAVVDQYEEKGFPMIDLMNRVGIDIATLGNHEFDYGEENLKNRISQSNFDWLCANINTQNSSIEQPLAYKSLAIGNTKVTLLGLIQTKENNNRVIPSTHPLRVKNFTFFNYTEIISDYSNLKETEQSDLYIALTHLGESTDTSIARNNPYFDMIIGGHSHSRVNKKVNNTYIYQAGSKLNNLGKIKVLIDTEGNVTTEYELIDLSTITEYDSSTQQIIQNYNENPDLDLVIGYSEAYHNSSEVGNFYTYALLNELNADLTFQNTGGIRNSLDKGDITKREIYAIDPFNNGSTTYSMTIGEIKQFLKNSGEGFYYAGLNIEQSGNSILIKNNDGDILDDTTSITLGLNDFIPAVYDSYFTQTPTYKPYTTAEAIINYLEKNSTPINFTNYNNYFKYE